MTIYRTTIGFDQIRWKSNSMPIRSSGIGSTLGEAVQESMKPASLGEYSLFTESGLEIVIRLLDQGEHTNALWSQYKGYSDTCSLIIHSGEIMRVHEHQPSHRHPKLTAGQTIAFQDTELFEPGSRVS